MAVIEDRLYTWLSDEWGGSPHVPSTSIQFRFGDSWPEIANFHNDAGELWIGTMRDWHTHMNRRDTRRLAWWLLWDWWVKSEWFGLRRWLWYKLLHRRVNRWQSLIPKPQAQEEEQGDD